MRSTEITPLVVGAWKASQVPSKSVLFDFLEEEDMPAAPQEDELSVEAELQLYLDDKQSTENPLEYWKANECRFKRLWKLAPRVLCAPGSTSAVERAFSVAGYILSSRRIKTSDENFESQLFSNLNLGLSVS